MSQLLRISNQLPVQGFNNAIVCRIGLGRNVQVRRIRSLWNGKIRLPAHSFTSYNQKSAPPCVVTRSIVIQWPNVFSQGRMRRCSLA